MASRLPKSSNLPKPKSIRAKSSERRGKSGDKSSHRVHDSRVTKNRPRKPLKRPDTAIPRDLSIGDSVLVHINNRLGGKTTVWCLATASIKEVKALAALQLGTGPEAMLLKRQGQWPFKDSLTLQDYEIGDNSSIDLEFDTTD